MNNIAIIGVGALGKRHLESALKSKRTLKIYVVDNNEEAVREAIKMDEKCIIGGTDTSILPEEIELAIIATSSAVRKTVFQQMISNSKVKYIIFEKVLFQRIEEYFEVEKLLKEQGIKAWVNCARREQPSYQELKKIVDKSNYFAFQTTGGDWGLGCNGIHMLDLVQFLSGSQECIIDRLNLLPIVKESKRIGYKEIYGTVSGSCGKCLSFSITCFPHSTSPLRLDLSGDNFYASIDEETHKLTLMSADDGWNANIREFPLYYQSQQTQKVMEKIMNTGDCNLPKYKEAMQLHLSYIEPLIKFFEEQGLEKGLCPIT